MRLHIPATLLAAGCAMTMPAPDGDAASLAQAERAFAAQSMRTDMVTAFLANFSDDGVLVTRGWAKARTALAGRPPPPIDLDWGPSHVEVAGSGELGLSTGPWIRTSRTQRDAPPAHGHFVSVWRRGADGRWQVEVDLGIPHPQAVAKTADFEVVPPAPGASAARLDRAEAAFVETSLRDGARAAYEAHASPRFMLYRQGHAPLRGKSGALAAAALGDKRTIWLADTIVAARSNDFGYVRGTYADAADPQRVAGYFLRVWRQEAGAWRIVLDVTNATG
jgi:ketosteroid isomerase-like protein